MAQAYDPQSGQIVDVAGAPAAGGVVSMLNPSGQFEQVPASEISTYEGLGYKHDTPELRLQMADELKYNTAGSQLAAAGLGAARGLSLGLSDLALTHIKAPGGQPLVKPETLRKLEEYNPGLSVGGELGSFAVPLVGEFLAASRLQKAAEIVGAGIKGVSKVGHLAEETVGKVVSSEAVKKAAGIATEAEIYNAAHNLNENVLGEQDLTAEKLLANSGEALAMGAGLSFGLSVGAKALGTAADKAKSSLSNLEQYLRTEAVPKFGAQAVEASIKNAGLSEEGSQFVRKAAEGIGTEEGLASREKLLSPVTPEERNAIQTRFQAAFRSAYDDVNKAVKKGFAELRGADTEKLLETVPLEGAFKKAEDLNSALKSRIEEMRARPDKYTRPGALKELERIQAEYEDSLYNKVQRHKGYKVVEELEPKPQSAKEVFKLLDDTKGTIDDQLAKWDSTLTTAETDTVDLVRGLRKDFRSALEDSRAFGDAASRQAALNSAYSDWSIAQKNLRKDFFKTRQLRPGEAEWVLNPKKINAYVNGINAARTELEADALTSWQEKSQQLIDQLQQSKNATQVGSFDRKALDSLLSKVGEENAAAGERLGQSAQLRALANAPFVTGTPLPAGAASKVGAAAGGALGGLVGGFPGAAVGAAVGEAASKVARTLKNPTDTLRALTAAEAFSMRTAGRINEAVSTFIDKLSGGTKKASDRLKHVGAAASVRVLADKTLGDHEPINKKKRVEVYQTRYKQLASMLGDPVKTTQALDANFHHLTSAAPGLKQALITKQQKLLQFVYDKAPVNPNAGKSINPLFDNWRPSDAEIAKWERYVQAAQDPLSVLDDLRHGSISRESVEALAYGYPELLATVRKSLLSRVTQIQKEIPYKDRLSLSILFDVPVDPTTDAGFIRMLQSTYDNKDKGSASSQGAVKTTAGALARIDIAGQTMTTAQQLQRDAQ